MSTAPRSRSSVPSTRSTSATFGTIRRRGSSSTCPRGRPTRHRGRLHPRCQERRSVWTSVMSKLARIVEYESVPGKTDEFKAAPQRSQWANGQRSGASAHGPRAASRPYLKHAGRLRAWAGAAPPSRPCGRRPVDLVPLGATRKAPLDSAQARADSPRRLRQPIAARPTPRSATISGSGTAAMAPTRPAVSPLIPSRK